MGPGGKVWLADVEARRDVPRVLRVLRSSALSLARVRRSASSAATRLRTRDFLRVAAHALRARGVVRMAVASSVRPATGTITKVRAIIFLDLVHPWNETIERWIASEEAFWMPLKIRSIPDRPSRSRMRRRTGSQLGAWADHRRALVCTRMRAERKLRMRRPHEITSLERICSGCCTTVQSSEEGGSKGSEAQLLFEARCLGGQSIVEHRSRSGRRVSR